METKNNRKKSFWIIDGSSLVHKEYFASLPEEIKMAKTPEEKEDQYWRLPKVNDRYINAIDGFFETVAAIITFQHPDYFAIAFDEGRDSFRQEIFPDYKAQRDPTPAPLKQQMQYAMELCEELGIPCLHSRKYEADDYVGSLTKAFECDSIQVHLMTTDRDYLQLLDENVRCHMMVQRPKFEQLVEKYGEKKGPLGTYEYDQEICFKELGIRPDQITDWKGISGDSSDNIPGIKGVADKTSVPLLNEYQDLNGIKSFLDSHSDVEIKEIWKGLGIKRPPVTLMRDGMDTAFFCKDLATIKTDIEVGGLENYVQNTDILDYKNLSERICLANLEEFLTRIEEYEQENDKQNQEIQESQEEEPDTPVEEDIDEYDDMFC